MVHTCISIPVGNQWYVRKISSQSANVIPDCEFLSFTNGTLIDEEFCQEMLRVKNFVPAISLEGFETANDGRRGPGVFDKVKHAMQLLKRTTTFHLVSQPVIQV